MWGREGGRNHVEGGNSIWGFVVVGGPNCGGGTQWIWGAERLGVALVWGSIGGHICGRNHGEGEPDVRVWGSGGTQLWVGPNGHGGPIWGMHPFGFQWGGGTMGRGNLMWGCVVAGDPIVGGTERIWGTHLRDAPI